MQKQLIIGILVAIAPSVFGAGQVGSVRTMTLKDCMEYAVANSTKIKVQQTNVDDAQINRREAILTALTPTVSASVSADYSFGRSIDPESNTYFRDTVSACT